MTELEHIAGLDAIQAEINRLSLQAFDRLLQLIDEGKAPRDAIAEVQAAFVGDYEAGLLQAFNRILVTSIGTTELRQLKIGDLTLSDRLYQHSRDVSATVINTINNHARGFHDARKLALQLYEGYGFRQKDPLDVRVQLPKYLRAAFGDDEAFKALWKNQYVGSKLAGLAEYVETGPELARLYANIKATNLKTPALKAAYLEALQALEAGQGKQVLSKLLKTAFYERNRYFANRIAQTELHRAYTDQVAAEIMADDGIQYVEFRMSQTHPKMDICDLFARMDKYGLGPGVYPKAFAPKPPLHPHCVPGDSLISASGRITAVSKRWFDGDVVVITTSSGKRITSTINHPILTSSGWVGAGMLNIGDKVISRVSTVPVSALCFDNKHYDMPASIAEIADAFFSSSKVSAREVPVSPEDFHGDGVASQVAVIGAYGELWDGVDTKSAQVRHNSFFNFADSAKTGLLCKSILDFKFKSSLLSLGRIMRGINLMGSLLRGFVLPFNKFLLRSCSPFYPLLIELFANNVSADRKLFREIKNGSTGDVLLDDIINIDRHNFSGYVYNLETEQGHYTCNGIITHNCRCKTSPRAWVDGNQRLRPSAERTFLDSLPTQEARQIMGSADRLAQMRAGKSVDDVLNAGKAEMYHLKRLGDFASDSERSIIHRMGMSDGQHAEVLLSNLIAAANSTLGKTLPDRLRAMWISDVGFDKHVIKRKSAGEINSADDYAIKTFAVLSSATKLVIAISGDDRLNSGKFQLEKDGWVVLVSEIGKVVTSYPVDSAKSTFEQNHERIGDKIHEHVISRTNREILKRVFAGD